MMYQINWIDIVDLCIASMGFTVAVMGLLLSIHAQFMENWIKKYFTIVFGITIAYIVSDYTSQISLIFLGRDFRLLSKAAVFSESFFSSLLMPVLAVYMLHLIGEKITHTFFYVVSILWGTYILLLLATQFTDYIYYITDENVYYRGPLYPVLLVPPVLLMIANLIFLQYNRDRFSQKESLSLRLYILIPLFSMILQMLFYGILIIVLGTSVSIMIMFANIMSDQIEKNIRQSSKIAEQRLLITTLQMRPHFIYNTLSNIYYLCDIDPEKAKTLIGNFTTYLQKNFHAITKQEPIPFEEELLHTKAYLEVAKVRYEGMINVKCDTAYTSFRLPPLTLEPIVENAVKHGLDPESDSLNIFIKTEHENGTIRIVVENDGVNYSEKEDSTAEESTGSEHIGLNNVRNRIKAMCNGTLDIEPRNGSGTVVTIVIPE